MAVWVVMVVGMLVLWDDMCYGYGGEQSVIVGNSLVVECSQGGDYSTLKAVDVVSVAYDRSSAPKDCRVSGWMQNPAGDKEKVFLLSEFTYDLEKSNAQTFNVLDKTASGLVDTMRLDFTSNHGNPSLTCIYRFRVHGYEPDPASMTAMQP
ncbi:hypothetical protein OIU85_006902 [Salix viminalis]|uniref:SUN domain-containing protein n=1 Tax=Salix viminalis TaxID=40686 RepID=A0A9Q0PM39_SALVM|nr:hypothetical protein OIU85_006902 [Salix viminalis]